jgi:hypothetical protein
MEAYILSQPHGENVFKRLKCALKRVVTFITHCRVPLSEDQSYSLGKYLGGSFR